MDLAQAFSELKSLPDTALQKELASPSGMIPGYMVLGELHERKTMRSGMGSPDDTIKRKSMAEEYMGDIKSLMPQSMMQPAPPAASPPMGMPPPPSMQGMPAGGIQGLPPAPQPQGYASGGIVGLAQGGSIRDYIWNAAIRQGIDPNIAIRVAQSEGGLSDLVRQSDVYKNGVREQSYGPFQLYLGGGLGNRALAAGIDPRKVEHGYRAIDFALAEAKNRGWGQWYGAAKAGIGDWEGIGGKGGGVYPEAGQAIAYSPDAAAGAGAADAAPVVAEQAADTAQKMATAEDAVAGDPMSKYLLMTQMFAQQQPTPPPAPAPMERPAQPVDYQQIAEETSMRPDFYRRQRYG